MAKKRIEEKAAVAEALSGFVTPEEAKALIDGQPQAPAMVACVVCGSAVQAGKACAVDGHVAPEK